MHMHMSSVGRSAACGGHGRAIAQALPLAVSLGVAGGMSPRHDATLHVGPSRREGALGQCRTAAAQSRTLIPLHPLRDTPRASFPAPALAGLPSRSELPDGATGSRGLRLCGGSLCSQPRAERGRDGGHGRIVSGHGEARAAGQ
ncbi:hypothetical protein RSPO_m01642 (plasmid) [Ralstonia solanacearum Po82]|uniref:Uncharacterized protein n=1 Tax=Ralstonia solanacearum (strain Po82) TaxID=1031711 RepID=F6GB74_RALS8|nr:hypothetical protein RSPO_m01642 [Ralstonia solanacearum Po82]